MLFLILFGATAPLFLGLECWKAYFGDEPNKNEIENIFKAIENIDITLE